MASFQNLAEERRGRISGSGAAECTSIIESDPNSSRASNVSDRSTRTSAWNRFDRKTVDFVLVDPQSFEVRKVVELDDRSHDGVDRKGRDTLVDDILGRAGITNHPL